MSIFMLGKASTLHKLICVGQGQCFAWHELMQGEGIIPSIRRFSVAPRYAPFPSLTGQGVTRLQEMTSGIRRRKTDLIGSFVNC